jgi:hypothetical protein
MALLGSVLILSGGVKALDLNLFVHQIQSYGLFSQPQLTALAAWALTTLECFLGAALFFNYRPRLVLNLTLLLLTAFTLLTLYAAFWGGVEECGCFGTLVKRSPMQAAAEDGVLLLLCLVARRGGRVGRSRWARMPALAVGGLTLIGAMLPFFSGAPATLLMDRSSQGGTIWTDLKVQGLDGADLSKGTHLVVLLSAGCQHCQESVPEVAMLMDELKSQTLTVVGLGQDSAAELEAFSAEWAPPYPIGRIASEAFWALLEDAQLPRIMLVEGGVTIGVWDQAVPSADEVLALLGR